jgi:hypothetical protein
MKEITGVLIQQMTALRIQVRLRPRLPGGGEIYVALGTELCLVWIEPGRCGTLRLQVSI